MMCTIFEIGNRIRIIQQNIDIFVQYTLYPSLISRKIWHSPSKTFSKHPLFITFLPLLTVSEVCNISNEYWLLLKSTKEMFLNKTPSTFPLFQKEITPSTEFSSFQKYPLFTTFFGSDWRVQYFKEYRYPSNLPTH